MKEYLEIEIYSDSLERQEILIAELSEIGFYAFEESNGSVKAWILKNDFDGGLFSKILKRGEYYEETLIENKNWNQEWEKSFAPVIINDFLAIRSIFHPPVSRVQHEIIITPKMSFGTGHHSTTLLMMRLMKNVDFKNKNILDFGTGTGILAILAEKLGAESVLAIDNDDWSITNAKENLLANGCIKSTITKTSRLHNFPAKDVILANINLQILLNEAENIAEISKEGTKLILSGFLEKDIETMLSKYQKSAFKVIQSATDKGWSSLILSMD